MSPRLFPLPKAGLKVAGLTAAGLMVAGCTAGPPDFPTSVQPPSAPRRPPGVALERPFVPPKSDTQDERTTVLVPPLDVMEARRLIDAFFAAVQTEDSRSLDRLFARGAVQQLPSGRELRSARDYWQRRFARLDYQALTPPIYRGHEVRVQRAEDARQGLATDEPNHPLKSDELSLTLQPLTTHLQNVRVFGPELTFLVVEEEGRLVIARILEDFQLL